ncbi:MAG: hypothetical protein IBX41_05115 [Methanophagales archaeon]|nr:hypothetical protein [Methanophagales archaeon]
MEIVVFKIWNRDKRLTLRDKIILSAFRQILQAVLNCGVDLEYNHGELNVGDGIEARGTGTDQDGRQGKDE